MPSFIPFLFYVFVTAFTPGPNNIMSMSNANRHGFKRSLKFILGVFTGFVIIMLVCAFFNLFLYNITPRFRSVMKIAGSLYMVFLAVKLFMAKSHGDGDKGGSLDSFLSGFALQFVNPKVILYGLTAIANFVIPYYKSNLSLVLFSLFLAFAGLLGTTSWAAFGALFQKLLSKYEKPFNILMGVLLLYSAVSILI